MKIHILVKLTSNPWGGANQFLKALKERFENMNVYTENVEEADIILFNSHHHLKEVFTLKKKYPQKAFIHRVDGPIYLIRGFDLWIDKILYSTNDSIAEGTIFQSAWSMKQNKRLGMKQNKFETTIINAPNPDLFNHNKPRKLKKGKKVSIVITSWSSHKNKGFPIYEYLDNHLDFKKYAVTFVGNSPVEFKHIKQIKPQASKQLARTIKQHDIFITASKNDPCSNSLIEALHCGLPVVVNNDGGHPEITQKAGEVFNDEEDVIKQINKVASNYDKYAQQIKLPSIEEVAQKYVDFFKKVEKSTYRKKPSFRQSLSIKLFPIYSIQSRIRGLLKVMRS